MNNLAVLYSSAGRQKESISLQEESVRLSKAKLGSDHPSTLHYQANLGATYLGADRLTDALTLLQETRKFQQERLGAEHPDTLYTMTGLAAVYKKMRRLSDAILLLHEVLNIQRRKLGPNNRSTLGTMARLGEYLTVNGSYVEAEACLRDCTERLKRLTPDHWGYFNAQSLLGGSLVGQKKFGEAEQLLLAGYAGMKARERSIPADGRVWLKEVLERIVRLYEAWPKPDQAKQWRKKQQEAQASKPKPEADSSKQRSLIAPRVQND